MPENPTRIVVHTVSSDKQTTLCGKSIPANLLPQSDAASTIEMLSYGDPIKEPCLLCAAEEAGIA